MAKRKKSVLNNYLDRIAVLTDDKTVFGVKTVRISNGYDFGGKPSCPLLCDDEIHIAAVALFAFWHGYERLIKGLKAYYQNGGRSRFHVHFVGDGPDLAIYKKLTDEAELDSWISFYGMKDSIFLNELYRHCHFGCCSLGGYKKDLYYSCELKSREYLAAGMPIIKGCDLDIDGDFSLEKYMLSVPNDPSLIEFQQIIEMYNRLYKGKSQEEIWNMRIKIYECAKERLNMDAAMRGVVHYINSSGRVSAL